ncbi:single-stranded DNA-binding protein [uncultured Campylobacter sp.]|uniref:single-stranded DNA-binding protein n=1 Tax=uncultured Campylobacter sp. TaxID=218934 RepID=UPI002613D50A|nr:single-stranded DNA-binding protein [uncultured Campylobacter sp.]
MNKVVLIGNLTRDIELRYTQSGYCVGNSGIAVTRKFKNAQGETAEETCFIDLKFFGRTAEVANQYLRKGSKLAVEGRLKLEQWQDQSGQNRSKHVVEVESLEMLGSPQNNQGGTQNYTQSGGAQSRAKKPAADKYDDGGNTIPF